MATFYADRLLTSTMHSCTVVLGTSLSGAALAASGTFAADPNDTLKSTDEVVVEPLREIPVVESVDVVVCGGGPAGISTAIAAARTGASVRLLEAHGCLGGVWTSGMLSYVIDAGKSGFNTELSQRLIALNAHRTTSKSKHYVYDVEAMKYVLEDLCSELKIRVQYRRSVATHGSSHFVEAIRRACTHVFQRSFCRRAN